MALKTLRRHWFWPLRPAALAACSDREIGSELDSGSFGNAT
jgi:hypothetical protein